MQTAIKQKKKEKSDYHRFDTIDGSHPFKKAVPNGFVDYQVRKRKGGKVRFFNYELAREMGLIPRKHPDKLTAELENKILDTFAIVIINEFDQMNGKKFPENEIKPGKYMATRYLQLQHVDKSGRTSGDGRSIWNGQVRFEGKSWDISSCGTGATRLSPATSKFNKFFETGDPSISYGCGYAEIDEGFATAMLSDIFHKNHIKTEQTLAVIEFEKGYSINVRVHSNLLRPSHFFGYLKQNDLTSLQSVVDFYIDSVRHQDEWKNCPKDSKKYDYFLNIISETFARTTATFEDEYIFCWLDWDGDNILMDGGIIDYGSIRQFGLFHYEYRYDDVDRFSTSIVEQKEKAKYIVQTFAQIVDYIKSGNKRSIKSFVKHKAVKNFDKVFEETKDLNLLFKVGLNPKWIEVALSKHPRLVDDFRKTFSYFERAKSSRGIVEVADGITWDAIFCMRDLLRELPQIYQSRRDVITHDEFIEIVRSNYADDKDLELTPYKKRKIDLFQKQYLKIVDLVVKETGKTHQQILLEISMRSSIINKIERVTGDAVTLIIDLILKKRKLLNADEIYNLFKKMTNCQVFDPREKVSSPENFLHNDLMRKFYDIVKEHREGI